MAKRGGGQGSEGEERACEGASRRRGGDEGCGRCLRAGGWFLKDPVWRGLIGLFLVASCCLANTGHIRPTRQIPVDDGFPTLGEKEWMRNGQILGPGSIPVDDTYWVNRMTLYDNYGNYKYGQDYYDAERLQGKGAALPGKNLEYTYDMMDDIKIINADTKANFWFGEVTQGGGFSASEPGKPWIRQSPPFTCDTNPYNECPSGNEDQCRANGCAKGFKLGRPIISPNGGNFNSTVLVTIEVEGLELKPSRLPSKPVVKNTAFQNGVCKRACEGRPTYPSVNPSLIPRCPCTMLRPCHVHLAPPCFPTSLKPTHVCCV